MTRIIFQSYTRFPFFQRTKENYKGPSLNLIIPLQQGESVKLLRSSGLAGYFSKQTDFLLSTEKNHPVEIDD